MIKKIKLYFRFRDVLQYFQSLQGKNILDYIFNISAWHKWVQALIYQNFMNISKPNYFRGARNYD